MTISKDCDPYWWNKQPKYKTSLAYNLGKDMFNFIKGIFTIIGILTTIVVGCIYTNNDGWICRIDDQFPKGIFIIHEYIIKTYGPA